MKTQIEEWKAIAECNGIYYISNHGRVKSFKYGKERILKPYLTGVPGNQYYSVEVNKNMLRAISEMQLLLANMTHGSENILCTGDFASSLGLVNDEMQDPNEFARLLFDRMHELFQKTESSLPSSSTENVESSSLKNLLPRIFKGQSMYSTKCLFCNHISDRTEDFMDFLLPIAKTQKSGKTEASMGK